MQISTRFTMAVHVLVAIGHFEGQRATSTFLAKSVNANPVVIRRILSQLRDAGIIEVKRGTGGASVLKPLGEITFLDVYRAVECIEENTLFHFHENPNPACPVGKNIHNILDDKLLRVQQAMERELASITLADVLEDLKKYR